jgi:hypothetical protein
VTRGPFLKVGGGVDDVGKSGFVWVHEDAQWRWAGVSFVERSLLREGDSHKKRGLEGRTRRPPRKPLRGAKIALQKAGATTEREPGRKAAGLSESPCATKGEPRSEDEEEWGVGVSEPTLPAIGGRRVGAPSSSLVDGVTEET